jgi:PAS domain S-box-containing protein
VKTIEDLLAENAVLRARIAELECELRAGRGDQPLRSVLENAPDFIAMITPEGRFLNVNRTIALRTREEVIGTSIYDYLPPGARAAARAAYARAVETGQPDEIEVDANTSDGRTIPFHTRIGPIKEGGRVVALCLISRDIGKIKQTERTLRETEDKLRLAIAASGVGLWTWDSVRQCMDLFDENCCRIFGVSADRVPRTRQDFAAMVHPDDRVEQHARADQIARTGSYDSSEYRIVRPDGTVRWVFGRAVTVRDEHGKVIKLAGGVVDVTERHELEERLRHSQKMEAVGALTAGIAHNFNNLLMAVLPSLEDAVRRAPADVKRPLDTALEASKRAARLVRELMQFAGRRDSLQRREDDVVELVRRALEMCQSTFPRHIRLRLDVNATLLPVVVDADRIQQVLLNLFINARDALDGVTGREPTISVQVERAVHEGAPFVRIGVTDNGAGMTPDVLTRVFDPFFTTKPIGRGTGLGLSTAYAAVKDHGGDIRCRSAPNEGTTFEIFLPTGRQPSEAAAPGPAPSPAGARGGERVLVVDDDPPVRAVVGRMLSEAGYGVEEAPDGTSALDLYTRGRRFDLVLLDESMPGLSGHDVLGRLLACDPAARVVLFTGRGADGSPARGAAGVLHKPVTMDALLRYVRRMLDGRGDAVR